MHKAHTNTIIQVELLVNTPSQPSHAENWPVHILAALGGPLLLAKRWGQLPEFRSLSCQNLSTESSPGTPKGELILQHRYTNRH